MTRDHFIFSNSSLHTNIGLFPVGTSISRTCGTLILMTFVFILHTCTILSVPLWMILTTNKPKFDSKEVRD